MMVALLSGRLKHSANGSIWLQKMAFGAEPKVHLINRLLERYTIGGRLQE